jgi:hypothetical protein
MPEATTKKFNRVRHAVQIIVFMHTPTLCLLPYLLWARDVPDSSNEIDLISVNHNTALAMTFARPVAFGGYWHDNFSKRVGNPHFVSLGD